MKKSFGTSIFIRDIKIDIAFFWFQIHFNCNFPLRFCSCSLFRLLRRDSEDSSVRCSYCSVLNVNENDLRRSFENTCTDSLVTAFDDEALLICDQGNEMARTKVYFIHLEHRRHTTHSSTRTYHTTHTHPHIIAQ